MIDRGDQGLCEDPGHVPHGAQEDPRGDPTMTCWSVQVGQWDGFSATCHEGLGGAAP